jgi:hypothetical protein
MPPYGHLERQALNFKAIGKRVQAAAYLGAEYDRELVECSVTIATSAESSDGCTDTSASMKGEAIDEAKLAALALLDALGDGDTLSVIVFGSRTSTLVPAVMLDAGWRAMIRAAIQKICRCRAAARGGRPTLVGDCGGGSGVRKQHEQLLREEADRSNVWDHIVVEVGDNQIECTVADLSDSQGHREGSVAGVEQ